MVCPSEALLSKPTLSRFVFYKLLTLIPVSVALVAIARHAGSALWIAGYVGLCLAHAAIMNAVKCPHCAYYKMGDRTFSCFMWWRTPKLYGSRPGPESRLVGHYAPVGMLVLTVFPVPWLWREWELLVVYLASIAAIVLSISINECARCLNFDCGHNTVNDTTRRKYLEAAAHDRSGSTVRFQS